MYRYGRRDVRLERGKEPSCGVPRQSDQYRRFAAGIVGDAQRGAAAAWSTASQQDNGQDPRVAQNSAAASDGALLGNYHFAAQSFDTGSGRIQLHQRDRL